MKLDCCVILHITRLQSAAVIIVLLFPQIVTILCVCDVHNITIIALNTYSTYCVSLCKQKSTTITYSQYIIITQHKPHSLEQ